MRKENDLQLISVDLGEQQKEEMPNPVYAYPVLIDCIDGKIIIRLFSTYSSIDTIHAINQGAVKGMLIFNQKSKECDLVIDRMGGHSVSYIEAIQENVHSLCRAIQKILPINLVDYKFFLKTDRDSHWLRKNDYTRLVFWSDNIDMKAVTTDITFYQLADVLLVFRKEETFTSGFNSRYMSTFNAKLLFYRNISKHDILFQDKSFKKNMTRSYEALNKFMKSQVEQPSLFSISSIG